LADGLNLLKSCFVVMNGWFKMNQKFEKLLQKKFTHLLTSTVIPIWKHPTFKRRVSKEQPGNEDPGLFITILG
jgi:hypothetical protein